MLEIKNTEIFGLDRAIRASGNAMSVGEIDTTDKIDIGDAEYRKHTNRAEKLGSTKVGSGHDHYLLGIHVQFDIKYPQYWTIEAERYHNFEIITSQSKMHRLTTMGKEDDFYSMFNKYVDHDIMKNIREKIENYNKLKDLLSDDELLYSLFMKIISNLPCGFEMWMTCDLTYLQLKTIYLQRRNHKLKEDWGAFCDWCETLPLFKELLGIK